MSKHWDRRGFYIVGEGPTSDSLNSALGGHACRAADTQGEPPDAGPAQVFRFGRMFEMQPDRRTAETKACLAEKLVKLGQCMNAPERRRRLPADEAQYDSEIPSGYTYLGQFIAHELTSNPRDTFVSSEALPENMRSPQIDLDSLYGAGPRSPQSAQLYQDHARLKEGQTTALPDFNTTLPNDLPRAAADASNPKEAVISEPRNDENLAIAQTHTAFIKFHNKVVDALEREDCPAENLFECARRTVVQHFQWIILEDYLPRFLDRSVLSLVRNQRRTRLRVEDEYGPFMPVEFAVAAFRVGHSMIRHRYEWNIYHSSDGLGGRPAQLFQLFKFTNFSGDLDGAPSLKSDWVIDWRRFYDFAEEDGPGGPLRRNMARKIDTTFDIRLDKVPGYPHLSLPETHRPITVRNLLRGLALGLPTGEEVAEQLGVTPLSAREVMTGPHREVLGDPLLRGKTPLWYYILKEAELNGGSRLGPVGSRIIAETFLGLIRNSTYSVLAAPDWCPIITRPAREAQEPQFGMTDLLEFADCVDPIGRHFRRIYAE